MSKDENVEKLKKILEEFEEIIEEKSLKNFLQQLVSKIMLNQEEGRIEYDEEGRISKIVGLSKNTAAILAFIKDTQVSLEKFSKSSEKYSKRIERLTYALIFLTVIQIIIILLQLMLR